MKALQATNAAPDGAGMGPAYLETATAALGLGALDVAQAALTKATDAMVDLPVPRAVLARQLTLQALYELSMVTGKGSVGASGEGPRPASLEIDHILLLTSQALDLDKGPNASLTWQIKGQAEQRSHLLEAAKVRVALLHLPPLCRVVNPLIRHPRGTVPCRIPCKWPLAPGTRK